VHALINAGVTTVAADRLDEAIAMFRHAVSVDPRNANAHRVLAIALMDRGDVAEGVREAREGLALRPDDPTLRELLAKAEAGARSGAVPPRSGR
jgi:Flp pilus assembly protein TadD